MLVGMSAANLQGVLASTVDVDVWIGLPPRQYIRVINLCRKIKATIQSPDKFFLRDETPVDFIYEIDGLKTFAAEFRGAKKNAVSQPDNSSAAVGTDLQKQGNCCARQG